MRFSEVRKVHFQNYFRFYHFQHSLASSFWEEFWQKFQQMKPPVKAKITEKHFGNCDEKVFYAFQRIYKKLSFPAFLKSPFPDSIYQRHWCSYIIYIADLKNDYRIAKNLRRKAINLELKESEWG
jgi:hypothetical protein